MNAYLSRSRMAGLGWPLPAEFDDAQLETLLYPPPRAVASERRPGRTGRWFTGNCGGRM